MKVVHLKQGKERSLERFHPWVFSGAIEGGDSPEDGELVRVETKRGQFLGLGHYQNASIAVRIISFADTPVDAAFWSQKFTAAFHSRQKAGLPNSETNSYRLVHGEGDGLTGLVVDIYDDTAVVQPHSLGMYKAGSLIKEGLIVTLGSSLKNILLKHPSGANQGQSEVLIGTIPEVVNVQEWGIKYKLDLVKGQKTGFFVDQRESRKRLGLYSAGKKVLNTFCYNGGFSLCALQGDASKVVSVDVSKTAIEQTQANLILNGYSAEDNPCLAVDTFKFLEENQEDFDIIVLDPPAFAKHLSARHQALKGYQRLNALAISQIKPGGILFTFSCSQVVDKTLFYNAIVAAAIQAGRQVKVLERLSQPADHPVSIYHPEGEYLKGLILEVI